MAAGVAGGKRLRGAHLRNRLVPVTAVGDRLVRDLPRPAVGGLYGRPVPGQRSPVSPGVFPGSPATSLCPPRTGHRSVRNSRAFWGSPCGPHLRRGRFPGNVWIALAGAGGGGVPAASDAVDGRIAARHRALDRDHSERRFLAGVSCTAPTSAAPYSAACSRVFTSCESTIWRSPRTSLPPSTWRWLRWARCWQPAPVTCHRKLLRQPPVRCGPLALAGSTSPLHSPDCARWALK